MTRIVIDFETYYDKDYSIKKITAEQYIRDSRFECIGLSIKVGDQPTQFFRAETWIPELKQLLITHKDHIIVSHNAMFDMGILGIRYGIHPRNLGDTVAMSAVVGLDRCAGRSNLDGLSAYLRTIGYNIPTKGDYVQNMEGVRIADMSPTDWAQYSEYCKTDSDICAAMYDIMLPYMPPDELQMISATIKMFTNPSVKLDTELLEDYQQRLIQKREDLLAGVARKVGLAGADELAPHLRSTVKFAKLLESIGVTVPTKYSEKQDKMIPAVAKTDHEFLELVASENELISTLCEARLGAASNLEMTRCKRFIDISKRGLMPVPLRYAAAHTGRYGGSDKINLQNLPKRKGDKSLRRSMTAPNDHVLIATDSSQIECRVLAYAAQELPLINIFLNKDDPYSDMASNIYGIPYDVIYREAKIERTKEGIVRRNVGKTTELGCGFGMGADKFEGQLKLDGLTEAASNAKAIVQAYRRARPSIVQFWKTCSDVLDIMLAGGKVSFGGPNNDLFLADGSSVFWGKRIPSVRLPNGTYIWYQNLRKVPRQEPAQFGDGMEFVYDQFKSNRFEVNRIYGGKLTENLIQALAFAVLKYQALQIVDMGVPVHMNVHDEWVSIVPKSMAHHAVAVHAKAMRTVPNYIPHGLLDMELDMGKNYADTTTIGGL